MNGRSGYNSHLSEILSMVLGPVAKEASGHEINSTGDLLSKVDSMNYMLSDNKGPRSNVSDNLSDFDEMDPIPCDFCKSCNLKGPTDREKDLANQFVNRVARKPVKSAMHVSNNLKLKLRASRIATKLYHRGCVAQEQARQKVNAGSPAEEQDLNVSSQDQTGHTSNLVGECFSDFSRSECNLDEIEGPINVDRTEINEKNGVVITGFDVESLYPSLRDIDAACLVRESIIHSNIDFDGFDYKKALLELPDQFNRGLQKTPPKPQNPTGKKKHCSQA